MLTYLRNALQGTLVSALSLPEALQETLHLARRGRLELRIADARDGARLLYLGVQQLILALLGVVALGAGYYLSKSPNPSAAPYAYSAAGLAGFMFWRVWRKGGAAVAADGIKGCRVTRLQGYRVVVKAQVDWIKQMFPAPKNEFCPVVDLNLSTTLQPCNPATLQPPTRFYLKNPPNPLAITKLYNSGTFSRMSSQKSRTWGRRSESVGMALM